MNNVRMGIIGYGNMGSSHATNIYEGKIKGMTLAAICDNAPEKIESATKNHTNVEFFADYKEMIDSGVIDAILIATPHYIHPDIAIYAFSKGLNVLSEKPAGVYTNQVATMDEAAKKAGTVYGIMYNQRTIPIYKKARELVQSGKLGEVKRLIWIITDWYRTQAYYDSGTWRATWAGEGGGVLINQCPHNLDLWQWIFGMPTRINATCYYGKYHNIEVEDEVTAYAEYENGAIATFITTTGECPGTNRLEITGDKGKIVIEDGELKFWELSMSEREWCFSAKEGFRAPDVTKVDVEIGDEEAGHNVILRNFTNAILHGEALIAPGFDGINGLTISNAIHLSSFTGGWVTLPLDAELYYKLLMEKQLSN